MHYAQTLSETAEREFLRFTKITADGRQLDSIPSDLYDALHLDQRADRILPNGWCMLRPSSGVREATPAWDAESSSRTADIGSSTPTRSKQTVQLIDARQATFRHRYGTDPCPTTTYGSPSVTPNSTHSARSSPPSMTWPVTSGAAPPAAPGGPFTPTSTTGDGRMTTPAPGSNRTAARRGRRAGRCRIAGDESPTASRSRSPPWPDPPTCQPTSSTGTRGCEPRSRTFGVQHRHRRRLQASGTSDGTHHASSAVRTLSAQIKQIRAVGGAGLADRGGPRHRIRAELRRSRRAPAEGSAGRLACLRRRR